MKVAICIEIKNENRYIREWLNYHRNLGFDNIILGDNNDSSGENIFDVLENEINSGFVIYENIKDKTNYQMSFYNYCITKYKDVFDWILFIDCDEFLELKQHLSVKDYLSSVDFTGFNQIIVNMYNYTGDNIIYDNGGNVLERFTKKQQRDFNNGVWQTKCFLRVSEQTEEMVFKTAHFVVLYNTTCDANGNKIFPTSFLSVKDELCTIRHYKTKTLEEYLFRHKYDCFYDINIQLIAKKIKSFFEINNEKTNLDEKISIIKNEFPWYSHCYNNCEPIDIVLVDENTQLLDYTIKSIRKNLTWINNIYVVSNNKINIQDIIVIKPKDIIDSYFINIKNIDLGLFLHNIPGLSERFIYVYSGTLFNYICFEDEFFRGDKICMLPLEFTQIPKTHKKQCVNNNEFFVNRKDLTSISTFKLSGNNVGYTFNNVCCPMRKYDNIACFNYLKNYIKDNISKINHLIYPIWSRLMYNNVNYICPNINIENCENPYLEITDPIYKIINIGNLSKNEDFLNVFKKKYKDIKIALCLVCKNESTYNLQNIIKHYKKIGFDNIIFYDCNDNLDQYQSIKKYIKNGFVIYTPCRFFKDNIKQNIIKLCYNTYKTEFDFLAFFDIDEFLIIKNFDNIKDYLKSIDYINYDVLQIDRKTVIYENKTRIGEFTNNFVKSIVKCEKSLNINPTYRFCTNIICSSNKLIHIDGNNNIALKTGNCNNAFNNIYIKHIHSKSFNSFINKIKHQNIKENVFNYFDLSNIEKKLKEYFEYVSFTDEHLKIINEAFPSLYITKESIFNKIDLSIKTKIDYVFPYVDNQDKEWIKEYNKYVKKIKDDGTISGAVRYESYDLLKFKFRSIEKNMPWIRNIYMIVSGPTQVPKWLDTSKVKIVYHKDIIPEQFLPTFNSSTIEMFIGNIKGLSDKFLYGNDDCYVNTPVMPYMFFRKNIPLIHLHERKEKNKSIISDITFNATNFIRNDINLIKENTQYETLEKLYIPDHHIKPLIKSSINKIISKHKKIIYNSCTKFRADNNFNQYLYHYYQVFNNKYISYKRNTTVLNYNGNYTEIINELNNKLNLFSLDFTKQVENKQYLYNIFLEHYENKSKYEK